MKRLSEQHADLSACAKNAEDAVSAAAQEIQAGAGSAIGFADRRPIITSPSPAASQAPATP
jgi:hypothetical protein